MLTAFLLLARPQDVPAALPADPSLDRPLAIEARIEALPGLLARIGREIGVSLTVERRMEDLKATILTPARPVRRTLTGLASVFDAEWVPLKEGGYRLSETGVARKRRESYLRREEDVRRTRAEAQLTRPVEIPEFVPTGDAEKDEWGRREFESKTEELPYARRIVATFARLSPTERERFWQGEFLHVIGRTESRPDEVETTETEGTTTVTTTIHPTGMDLTLIRYIPFARSRSLQILNASPNGGGGESMGGLLPDEPTLADHPFRRAQREWKTDLGSPTVPQWSLPLREMPAEPTRWAQGATTSSDLLWEIHRRCEIPIVAEANRQVMDLDLPFEGKTLGEALRLGLRGDSVRLEEGTLLHRPWGFWQTRPVEPPESVLAAFERETKLSIESLATLYAALSPTLPRGLFPKSPPFASTHALPVRSSGIDGSPEVPLRLWGHLTPALRERLVGGERIPLASLDATAGQAVRAAVIDGAFGQAMLEAADGAHFWIGNDEENAGDPVGLLVELLGLRPGRPFALSATRTRTAGPPERTSLSLRIVDARGSGLRFPTIGPY